ncbi:protein NODULATION SIGNALING PATHWAY 2-like [Cicer arietinum]|uniref:Scarecrow-like protein 26 n=1 Tax=Cicer arietinum TaxID=3827 RepID=A0A1S2XPH2_CICAR|nr:scarecrow-like protein 26 [Cicer arietinum]
MYQPEILQSPWLFYEDIDSSSTFDHHHHQIIHESYGFTNHVDDYDPSYGIIIDDHVDDDGFNTLLTTSENSTSTIFTNDHIQFEFDEQTFQLPSLMDLDPFDSILTPQIDDSIFHDHGYQQESESSFLSQNFPSDHASWSPSSTISMKSQFSSNQPSLNLPQQNMEIENHVSLPHLMEAHGEALEQGQKQLAEIILKCISQKVTSPLGESLETLAFYLSQHVTKHVDYLKGEAYKNFEACFKALYQGNLVGKVAHFASISSILEAAMLEDCDVIHVIDFCIGNGIQWPFLLEAVSKMNKTLKLTSIKWCDDESFEKSQWNFDDTKRNLYEQAKSCGLKLKVEEKGLEELVFEIKRINKRGLKKEFLAFNLMIGLPHMRMVRNKRKNGLMFLKVAKDLIKNFGIKGMITFGDGDAFEKLKNCLNFKSFFEGNLVHYKALLESIESQFSAQFLEARTACEVLFVAPCVSSLDWLKTWEEMKSDCEIEDEIGLEGSGLSKNVLMEVGEVLRGSESSYEIRNEGQNVNQLVLEWKGTQLLRFSIWKN